ncbi:unnamed protein product [Lathyrus sativus]|nr:unnamed protein product [Lathyrus sativus]
MELIDVPVVGNKITWFKANESCKIRLDKILLSDDLILKWGIMVQQIGDGDISDHMPIWLKLNVANWGPKPFKVFNSCYENPNFIEFVKDSWNFVQVVDCRSHILVAKFKTLGEKLRWWNKNVYGWVDLSIEKGNNILNEIDLEKVET